MTTSEGDAPVTPPAPGTPPTGTTTTPSAEMPPGPPAPPPPAAARPEAPRQGHVGTALAALTVGLLGFTLFVVSGYTRDEGELDWSYAGLQIAAVALALVGGLAARFAVSDPARRSVSAGWLLGLAAVGSGAVVATFVESTDTEAYVVGGAILAVAVVGYLLAPGGACAIAAVVGLAFLVAQGIDDGVTVGGPTSGYRIAIIAITAFAVVVTALGWALPRSRQVTAGFVGAAALAGLVGVVATAQLSPLFVGFAGVSMSEQEPDWTMSWDESGSYLDEVAYYLLGAAGVLVCLWLLLAALSDAIVPRVLAAAGPVVLVPVAMWTLEEDPLWWAVSALVVGVLTLGMATVLSRSSGGASSQRTWKPVEPPPTSTT